MASTFDAYTECAKMFEFKTKSSSLIKLSTLIYSINFISRIEPLNKLTKYVNMSIANEIEEGIMEYSMIKISTENMPDEFLSNVYNDKLNDVLLNIDPTNQRIKNTTLNSAITNGHIAPHFVAFFSCEQLHPLRWKDILDIKQKRENDKNNIKTSDLYKCYHCGERKTKTSQMQTRSSDEAMTIFVTCLNCYNTFTK